MSEEEIVEAKYQELVARADARWRYWTLRVGIPLAIVALALLRLTPSGVGVLTAIVLAVGWRGRKSKENRIVFWAALATPTAASVLAAILFGADYYR